MKGECLCRRVTIEVDQAPGFINVCNCKLCRKSGAAWGYYLPPAVTVDGETATYSRDDLGYDPWCELHFCRSCGSATHFVVTHPDHEGIGVNTRLFAQAELDGIEVHYYDTRARSRADQQAEQTAHGTIGDGRAF